MEVIFDLLNSYSVILVVATLMITAFAKCITKIFRMGVDFKADIATKTEQREFEEEIRRDMRGYAVQIQKTVSDSMMTIINNRLKDIDNIKDIADNIKITNAEIDLKIKSLNEKTDNVKEVSDALRNLSNRVQRLEYNNTTQNVITKPDRRSEN